MYGKPSSPLCCILSLMVAVFLWSVPQIGWTAANTPASSGLTLSLSPKDPAAWRAWRQVYDTEVTFVATLDGTDATQSLSDVTWTFTLSDVSSWPGYCMNMGTQTASDKDLEFREADQPTVERATDAISNRGQTVTVTFAEDTTFSLHEQR